jgi:hypothetical protein
MEPSIFVVRVEREGKGAFFSILIKEMRIRMGLTTFVFTIELSYQADSVLLVGKYICV